MIRPQKSGNTGRRREEAVVQADGTLTAAAEAGEDARTRTGNGVGREAKWVTLNRMLG